MEERLDDAINVLQKHAQSSVDLGLPVGPMGTSGGLMSGAAPHSGSGPMGGANISSYTGQYLDSHMVSHFKLFIYSNYCLPKYNILSIFHCDMLSMFPLCRY